MIKKFPENLRVPIGVKLTALLVSGVLLAVAGLDFYFIQTAEEALKKAIFNGLVALATAKEKEISSIIEKGFERTALIASRTRLRECLAAIEEGDPAEFQLVEKMNQILDDALNSLEALKEISVTDEKGVITASTNRNRIGDNVATSKLFTESKKDFYLGGLYARGEAFTHETAGPMLHPRSGKFIGVIIVRIELFRLAEALSERTGLGETGEFVLGVREGNAIELAGPLRHVAPDGGNRLIQLDDNRAEPMLLAMARNKGIIAAKDYRGVEVLAAYRHVDVADWGLVAKIDAEEAFQPIKVLKVKMILFGFFLSLGGFISAYMASRFVSKPLRALQHGVNRLARGRLDYRIKKTGNDEIGDLGRAFNRMAARLSEDEAKRRRAEQELRDAHEYLQQLISSANVMIIGLDALGRVKLFNKAAEQITGYSFEELAGIDWFGKIVPKDRFAHVWELFQNYQSKTGEIPLNFENQILTKSGEERFISWQNATIISPDKEISTISFGMDVTKGKRAERELLEREEELQESEIFLKESQRIGQIGNWDWDATIDAIRWSEEYYRVFNFDPEAPTPNYQEHLKVYTAESAALLDVVVQKAMKTGESYEVDLEIADPSNPTRWICARGEAKKDDKGNITGLRGTAQNVTEKKLAREKLQKLNEELEQRVQNRTAELAAKNEELERLNRLFVGRELRMAELKKKILALSKKN